jgi:hypothetical protein
MPRHRPSGRKLSSLISRKTGTAVRMSAAVACGLRTSLPSRGTPPYGGGAENPGTSRLRVRPTNSRHRLTTPPPSTWLRDAHCGLVSREAGCPWWPLVWLGADRPHQPPAVTLEDVLAGMGNHQLAASTHAVDLAAAVAVHEVGERVTRGRLLSHASWWPAGPTSWEADRRAAAQKSEAARPARISRRVRRRDLAPSR